MGLKEMGQPIGAAFTVESFAKHWLVSWSNPHAANVGDEEVSFTVSIPKNADLSISELQTFALQRAVELLQVAIRLRA